MDNKVLINRLKNGEESAYMHLVDQYYRRLYAYALTLINEHAAAQDIVQNVFTKTWQFRKKLDDRHSLQNFLFKSVYNEFVNAYKKNEANKNLYQKYYEVLQREVQEPDEQYHKGLVDLVVQEAEKLPPKCKKVFFLSKREGLTNAEISEYLDISIKAVEAQITKAFSALRKKLLAAKKNSFYKDKD
ncbi:MAG: RNA polymerase sigma-70 factor [Bacteroidota bacterium]